MADQAGDHPNDEVPTDAEVAADASGGQRASAHDQLSRASSDLIADAFKALPIPLLICDEDGRVIAATAGAQRRGAALPRNYELSSHAHFGAHDGDNAGDPEQRARVAPESHTAHADGPRRGASGPGDVPPISDAPSLPFEEAFTVELTSVCSSGHKATVLAPGEPLPTPTPVGSLKPLRGADSTRPGLTEHISGRQEAGPAESASRVATTRAFVRQALAAHEATAELTHMPGGVLTVEIDRWERLTELLDASVIGPMTDQVLSRVRAVPAVTAARGFGEGRFTATIPGPLEVQGLIAAAGAIRVAIGTPCNMGTRRLTCSASVGAACVPSLDDSAAAIERATSALSLAKADGGNRAAVFERDVKSREQRRRNVAMALSRFEEQDLRLAYQPIFRTDTGRVEMIEALLRWNHPDLGPIGPAEFVPIADQSGLMPQIGKWVIGQACHTIAEIRKQFHDVSVCVNIGDGQLSDPDIVETVRSELIETGVPPHALVLEVTEALLESTEGVGPTLEALDDLGIVLALDNFGSGHSSLQALRRFPFRILKLDGTFVQGIVNSPADRSVVRSVLGLAASLRMGVVAERVERAEQLDMLRSLGCTYLQGYALASPCSSSELFEWLLADNASSHIERAHDGELIEVLGISALSA